MINSRRSNLLNNENDKSGPQNFTSIQKEINKNMSLDESYENDFEQMDDTEEILRVGQMKGNSLMVQTPLFKIEQSEFPGVKTIKLQDLINIQMVKHLNLPKFSGNIEECGFYINH